MRYIIGVDLGGTQLRAGLVDASGVIVAEERTQTQAHDGPEAIIDKIVAGVTKVRTALPIDGELLGVGIGAPGPLNPFEGIIYMMPNLPGWQHLPLRDVLEQRIGLPIELGKDTNAAVLGEWLFGAGKGTRNLVYVTISTGIGGGVICDGRLLLGHRGIATEVGFHIIDPHTLNYWEDVAAGPALAVAASEAMTAEQRSLLHELATPETVTAAHVSQAAAAGDTLALRLLDHEGELIGLGLVSMLHLYGPELVLLGGGVVVHNPQLIVRAKQVINERALPVYRDIPIQLAALGDRAGLVGAGALFLYTRGLVSP
ncbi:MAG: ROK family protein [Chloroflexi bacterium AL-W]|nr:ROK family protein [Chloroflexi bacterium AL-N1]NOK65791.1 ROK family protein [Chloroflexi bacterium AL-N10]NOK74268.1 ROK family protein [Chloroflexi bacterium AL-N5]NOK80824.1 ROK family protein [Chloroflexi bacterium AL-W]NOK88526.1 ROK family protein [Chloroflexi bacterium AL-N15]